MHHLPLLKPEELLPEVYNRELCFLSPWKISYLLYGGKSKRHMLTTKISSKLHTPFYFLYAPVVLTSLSFPKLLKYEFRKHVSMTLLPFQIYLLGKFLPNSYSSFKSSLTWLMIESLAISSVQLHIQGIPLVNAMCLSLPTFCESRN